MNMVKQLIARSLSFSVGETRLIQELSVELSADKLSVVMGQSGAGKSLFLRLLHGLILPSSGSVTWCGRQVDASVRLRQAMIFQRPVLLRRSVAANIDFVLGLRGSLDKGRRDSLLEQVGLLKFAQQSARSLSGGEQQRLALARALAVEPEVLFLDEPTASLDPASILLMEDLVAHLQRRGIKVIWVTHDLGQARRLADEVLFLHKGCLLEKTPADQFFTQPASEAARAYLRGQLTL